MSHHIRVLLVIFILHISCILPAWMLPLLRIGEGAAVHVSRTHVVKADSCSLRPLSLDFYALRDHRLVHSIITRHYPESYIRMVQGRA